MTDELRARWASVCDERQEIDHKRGADVFELRDVKYFARREIVLAECASGKLRGEVTDVDMYQIAWDADTREVVSFRIDVVEDDIASCVARFEPVAAPLFDPALWQQLRQILLGQAHADIIKERLAFEWYAGRDRGDPLGKGNVLSCSFGASAR